MDSSGASSGASAGVQLAVAVRAMRAGRPAQPVAMATFGPVQGNLTENQLKRLDMAAQLARGTGADRRRAIAVVRQVERELAAAREARVVEQGIADTLARARARGEDIEIGEVEVGTWRKTEFGEAVRRDGRPVLDVQRVRRASRVDGLVSLLKAGTLTAWEFGALEEYRRAYERARPPLGTSTTDGIGARGAAAVTPTMMVAVAEAGTALGLIRKVREACPDARVADVLEAVAGRGLTIRSLGAGGDQKAANVARLRKGMAAFLLVRALKAKKGLANQAREEHEVSCAEKCA